MTRVARASSNHGVTASSNRSFDSPRGEKTAATMNPGLSYVEVTWQLAAEAIVPLNSQAGRTIGGRVQALFFLDDLIPSIFGKPLFSR